MTTPKLSSPSAEFDLSDALRYRHVAIDGESLADALRGAADFLDSADTKLDEPLFVVAMSYELQMDVAPGDKPWRLRLLANAEDVDALISPSLLAD